VKGEFTKEKDENGGINLRDSGQYEEPGKGNFHKKVNPGHLNKLPTKGKST